MEITIKRFKNIGSVKIPVNGITLLVGGNNSGKSSILQAVQFGVSAAQTSDMQGGFWGEDRLSTSIGQSDLVYSPIKEVTSLAKDGRLRESVNEAISIIYADNNIDPVENCRINVTRGRNKNIRLELVGKSLGTKLQSMSNPFCALVTGLAGVPSEERFETNIVVRKAAARGDSNSVFRNILLQVKRTPAAWAQFHKQINKIFPGYTISVDFNPDSDEHIQCQVSRNGVVFPIDTCGTGVLQAVQIFSYINLFKPKLLLLDEPDSHLHPNNQKALAKELIAAAEEGLNIVISSHSKHLVEPLLEVATLVWLRNGTVEPNVENYEVEALMEIGALGLGERIGNPSHIFLTEDEDKSLLEILLDSNGYDEMDYEIVSYSGATNYQTAVVLINQLRKSWPAAKYAIHFDRDFKTDDEVNNYKTKFSPSGVKVFVPDGNDLEFYFTRAEHLEASCGIDAAISQEILVAAFAARRSEMLAKYVNTRIENIRKNGGQVNAGAISVEGTDLLTGPTSTAIHGKIMLKAVRDELRTRNLTDHLLTIGESLKIDSLQNLWNETPMATATVTPPATTAC